MTDSPRPNLLLPASYDAPPEEVTTERHSQVGRKGDLVVELHFGNFDDKNKRTAAFFLYASDPARGIYVPLKTMWEWAEKDALHTIARRAAEHIYPFCTRFDCFRVLDAVLDFLGDLKNSPVPPVGKDRSLDAFMADFEEATEGGSFFVEKVHADGSASPLAGTRKAN